MEQRSGAFFVIEGTDGSGKGTQYRLLQEILQARGYEVATYDFPRYDETSAYFVKQYLNGDYGALDEVGPYVASLFYALDRYDTARDIEADLAAGKVVLSNRYASSNMAFQGAKFDNEAERKGFFLWLDNLEFELLKIPRPDKHFVLQVPADVAQKQVDLKAKRNYTEKQRDIHEADLDFLQKSVAVYEDLCRLFPADFTAVDCMRAGKLLPIDAVSKLLVSKIEPYLPNLVKRSPSMPKQTTKTSDDNPFVIKTKSGWELTDKGLAYLEKSVTDVSGDVYAFKDHLSPMTIAAGMARLSRRGDDMRITILDEFAPTESKDEKLLQRVISAYGDDSVQQLVGTHVVVENASNLLTKQLEWGRLAAYLEQSTRYIYFDEKDTNGNFKYYVPTNLDDETLDKYRQDIDQIFEWYSEMVHEVTEYVRKHSSVPEEEQDAAWRAATRAQACDAVRPVLPVATKSTVGIFASGQALESLIMRLRASDSTEARQTGEAILEQARQVIPTFLERADKPERGGAMTAYLANTRHAVNDTIKQILPETYAADTPEAVRLVDYYPKNELDTVPYIVYEHSNESLEAISHRLATKSYEDKAKILEVAIGERLNRRHKPGRAFEIPHYTWDIICDYGIFRDLQRHRIVDNLTWQALTPRYGYDIPDLIEQAGQTETYEACFDKAFELYGTLQANGYYQEAQYATLLGHKMRWTITYNARQAFHFHELRTTPHGHPGYRKLVHQMHKKLCEVHPLIGNAMQFVNQDEDPELTRLAAERYTQYKLQAMSDS